MELSGNKGEWSEVYVFFRLLGEGKLHTGDALLNKKEILPIIKVIRGDALGRGFFTNKNACVVIVDEVSGNEVLRIPMNTFMQESKRLLDEISFSGEGSLVFPKSEKFFRHIGCYKLKAPSDNKADIRVMIHDSRTGMNPTLGFSIKSQLGSPSTLLNPGKTTNFLYRVTGACLSEEQVKAINGITAHRARMEALFQSGCRLEYEDMENATFKNNLLFIDCCLPMLVGECLSTVASPTNESPKIDVVVNSISRRNPLNYTGTNVKDFYAHKLKTLLIDAALGMTPGKVWNGRYDANGGYIVVKTDGDLVCYHFYDRNDVEDYLYCNTRFEAASRGRYGWGSLFYSEDGLLRMRLNLQIRFIK